MRAVRGGRWAMGVMAAGMVLASGTGCALDKIPPWDAAIVGLSWLKDLVIPQNVRLWNYPADGCYQNGVRVDCATMTN